MAIKKPAASVKKPKTEKLSDYVNSDEYLQFLILTHGAIRENLSLCLGACESVKELASDADCATAKRFQAVQDKLLADLMKMEEELMAWHERAKSFED